MTGRRSLIETKIAVLLALKNKPLILTHILNATNTNSTAFKPALERMIETGLVEIVEPTAKQHHYLGKTCKRQRYRLTLSGKELLKVWDYVEGKLQ
jgi:predicted transcriptional regulator